MNSAQMQVLVCIMVALVDGVWFGVLMRSRVPHGSYVTLWAGSGWLLTTIGLALYPHVTPEARGVIYVISMSWSAVIMVLAQVQTTGELVIDGYTSTISKTAGAVLSFVVVGLQVLPMQIDTYRASFHLGMTGLYIFAIAVGLIPAVLHLLKEDDVLRTDAHRAVIRTVLIICAASHANYHAWGWSVNHRDLIAVFIFFPAMELAVKVWGLHRFRSVSPA